MEDMEPDKLINNPTNTNTNLETETKEECISLNKELGNEVVVEDALSDKTTSNQNSTEESIEKSNTNNETSLHLEINEDVINNDQGNDHSKDDSKDSSNKLQLLTSDNEDGDDVPGDFFDDFLKEDFMAGLDVVDDDDWDHKKTNEKVDSVEVIDLSSDTPEMKVVEKKAIKDKKNKKSKHKEDKSIKSNRNNVGIHRDPNKTRRDIELDKARCERDKELKRISEKLKLVETGLVPPGMEMETDIEVIEKQEKIEKFDLQKPANKFPESPRYLSKSPRIRSKTPRIRSKSPMHKTSFGYRSRSPLSSKPSPKVSRNDSRTRHTSTSHHIYQSSKPYDRSEFPRRSRDRHHSPRKSRDRRQSPYRPHGRQESPGRHGRHESPKRLPRHDSPFRHLDRRGSPIRREHDRRGSSVKRLSRRRSHGRSRSRSHTRRDRRSRSRSRSYKKKRNAQLSFLEEIAEKLRNADSSHAHVPSQIYAATQIAPVPAPVPAPPLSTQYPLPHTRYDQNYFVGTSQTNIPSIPPNIPLSQPAQYQVGLHGQMQSQVPLQQPFSTSMPLNFNQLHVPNNLGLQPQASKQVKSEPEVVKEDIHKLYEDKKITLADFLAITAKPEVYSASPVQMKEKIKVISRCQDAIKYLGNTEKHFTGPLILRKEDNNTSTITQDKFKSPLLKSSDVKLPFTELPNTAEQKSKFFTRINTLLENLGLVNDVIVIDDPLEVDNDPTSVASTVPTDTLPSLKLGANKLSKLSQTDGPRCVACEKRSKILTKSTSVQCGEDFMKFSVATQVREDDFYPTLPKTQSLASLTPAQLLAGAAASMTPRNSELEDYQYSLKKNRPTGFPNRIIPPKQVAPPPRGFFDSSSIAKSKYNYF